MSAVPCHCGQPERAAWEHTPTACWALELARQWFTPRNPSP